MEDSVAGAPPSKFRFMSYVIHRHDHVRKCCHEHFRFLGDRRASDRGRSVVDAQRTVLSEEHGDLLGILAAPRLGVPGSEVIQFAHIIGAGS